MKKFSIFFILTVSLFAKVVNNKIRFSFTNVNFNKENMGLVESSYLFDFNYFYTGIGIYSAVTGKRGGFFVGGVDIGINYPVSFFYLTGGLFLGGGGGGAAPQGGGLMSRIYAALKYKNFGIGINKIKFINGDINSNSLFLEYEKNFKDYYFFTIPKTIKGKIKKVSFSPFYEYYFPLNSKTTGAKKQLSFGVVGAEINIDNNLLDVGGALKGESDGYAEIYIGKEKDFKFLKLKGFIGASGGGKVDTGGGFCTKGSISTNFRYFNIESGFIKSSGDFKGYFIKGSLNTKFNLIIPGNKKIDTFIPKKFEFKLYNERYLQAIDKSGRKYILDNLTMDINYFINNYIYFGVSTSAGIDGGSGGYATGMWNSGIVYKNIFAQFSLGAAGGGGVDVNGGLISKIEAGYNFKHFFISAGKIKSMGKLNTSYINFGYRIKFYKLFSGF